MMNMRAKLTRLLPFFYLLEFFSNYQDMLFKHSGSSYRFTASISADAT
jgi:hypothetical protein